MQDAVHAEGLSMADRYVLSVNTKPEIRDRLDRLAAVTRRSKSFLANEAIERYLAAEEEFVERVEARRAETRAARCRRHRRQSPKQPVYRQTRTG